MMQVKYDEYRQREDMLKEEFSDEFIKKCYYSAIGQAILQSLIRRESPYKMIEILIDKYEELFNEFKKYIELYGSPNPNQVFINNEEYELLNNFRKQKKDTKKD